MLLRFWTICDRIYGIYGNGVNFHSIVTYSYHCRPSPPYETSKRTTLINYERLCTCSAFFFSNFLYLREERFFFICITLSLPSVVIQTISHKEFNRSTQSFVGFYVSSRIHSFEMIEQEKRYRKDYLIGITHIVIKLRMKKFNIIK